MNIDNWSLDDLMQMVQDYYVYCGGDQQTYQPEDSAYNPENH